MTLPSPFLSTGMMNVNPETGIPYGVIAAASLDADLVQRLTFELGRDVYYEEALAKFNADVDVENPYYEDLLQDFNDDYYMEEPVFEGEYDGVRYRTFWLGGAELFWIFYSPYTAHARPCSPCVPGAGDLDDLDPEGMQCYTVPDDWRDGFEG